MNHYTYQCSDCDNVFEIKATLKEKDEGVGEKFVCPKCHSKKTKQKFSLGNFFKNIFGSDDQAGGCCPDKSDKKGKGGCCG